MTDTGIPASVSRVFLVIAVGDDQTVCRDEGGKFPERPLHVLKILEKVQMIGDHVENDRSGREEVQERIAVFAAFENDRVALADAMPRASSGRKPPIMIVGSRLACMKMCVSIEVVVVLPCVPETQMAFL